MHRMNASPAIAFVMFAAACGGTGTGTGTSTAAPAPPAAGTARLSPGALAFGCFAWSDAEHAAACITGDLSNGDGEIHLEYVGAATPPVVLERRTV